MKFFSSLRHRLRVVAVLVAVLAAARASAYPPAPHHVIYGMVRNQYGDPITVTPCDIYLETPTGVQLRASVVNGLEPGVNYRLEVPMDSGTAADLYQPTALKPYYQFRIRVKVGDQTYLPIEMSGNFSQIGQPGLKTRIDLTLGVDSDGDGLPDAWEQALIDVYGGTLASIRPGDDTDGDGISNLDEYLAGTYAFDPSDGFRLTLTSVTPEASRLEFLVIRGRTYSLFTSTDLLQWKPVGFRPVSGETLDTVRTNHLASDVRMLTVEVPAAPGTGTNRYFKALVR